MSELTTRDYSSNYSIKNFIKNDIGANYFNFDKINALNIGTFGFLTDVEASQAEDISNIISTYAKEIFPNLAEIPESIYSYAGLYQVNDILAKPAKAGVMLFVNEDSILKYSERRGEFYEFFLDSSLIINVDGYDFSPDYDIKITYRKYRDELVFSAMYEIPFKNSLSDINNPYIKIKRITFKGENYLGLILTVRRVSKTEVTETLISNDKINLPRVKFSYLDQLCNFEVLYRPPGSEVYTQLEKRFYMSEPSRNPFCYFRLTDTNEVELSFTSRDGCFQPKFNSELLINVYTCNGAEDNRPLYKGDNITVQPGQSVNYPYNQNLVLLALVQTKSFNGVNMPGLDEIKQLYLEKMITMDSYTTENDLQIYFNKIKNILGNDINFIKKRDDIFERLFCAFSLMKDSNGDIYHTNTLNLRITDKSVLEDGVGNVNILKPGKVMRYLENKRDMCVVDTSATLWDQPENKNDFLYTCPFLLHIQKNPENVFFFYNSINEDIMLDYSYSNVDSYVQFICSTINVYRNATVGDSSYKFKVDINPSVDNYRPIVTEDGAETGALKVKIVFPNTAGVDSCSIDLHLTSSDTGRHIYTYEGELKTNDIVNINNEMMVCDVYNLETRTTGDCLIPMNTSFKLLTLFDYGEEGDNRHRYSSIQDIENITLTNIYTNDPDEKLDLMISVPNCRSKITFVPSSDGYDIQLSSLPLLSTAIVQSEDKFQYFIDSLKSQYMTVSSLMEKITNNYSIDMKFYNTYGRSNNFILGEDDGSNLDRVNCSIKFKVSATIGADETKLVSNIKSLIKTYIEGINKNGYNGIYISNLIKHLENNISEIEYLKFICINEYDSMVQVIDNKDLDISTASKDELRSYIPEFLTIDINDIIVEIISSNTKQLNKKNI